MTMPSKKARKGVKITEKMTAKKQSSFPLKTVILLISLAIASLVYFDVKQHGTWNDSVTRKTLKEYRVCEYACLAVNRTKEGLFWVDGRIEENFPGYHKTVKEVSEPYVELAINVGKIARNGFFSLKDVLAERCAVLLQVIDAQIPGFMKFLEDVMISVVLYVRMVVDIIIDSFTYLREKVFVGQLSPENVQKVVVQAFNTTQQKAAEYYHWIYEKVQTSIK